MKKIPVSTLSTLALTLAGIGLAGPAAATDGYFAHGYGMTAKGMGGVAVAMSKDSFGGANNPASMVWAGNRLDLGVDLFSPKRDASRQGAGPVGPGTVGINGSAESGKTLFAIPEFGYNRMLGDNMSVGVSAYGNGGMNTEYPGGQLPGNTACPGFNGTSPAGPFNLLCGTGRLGVDLVQLVIAPTLAMKVGKDHSFGISPLIGYQRFKAEGLDGFQGFTASPATFTSNNNLTNRGHDSSHGFGVRLGWMGKFTDSLTIGAAYSTKMKMSKFDKYKDLFAEDGDFDIPRNYSVGIAFKASPALTIAADYQRIEYSGIKSVGNPSTNTGNASPLTGFTVGSLGCSDCRGFGWNDIGAIKLGVEYQYSPTLTLRAGYNHSDNPIEGRDVTFNILAPAVVKDHLTLGFTYAVSKDSEITMAYMHAFKESLEAPSLFNAFGLPAGTEKIQMYENSLGIAWAWKM